MVLPKGSGFGSSTHTPHEADDSLQAQSFATIVDAYSEGECVGLCDRAWNPIVDPKLYGKGIFLNKTPLMSDDGFVNFENVYISQVFGTQSQSFLPGADIVSDTVPDGRELKHNVAKTIAINVGENSADRIGIALSYPALYQQESNGDITPVTNVQVKIEVQLNSDPFYLDQTVIVSGKASSEYVKEVMIKLPRSSNPAADSWLIRLTRLTADSTKFTLKNASFISYYTRITDSRLRYPNTAAIMVHGDAKQFTSIPVRGYRVRLLKIKVPSNYFPDTRKYTRSAHGGDGFSIGDDTGVEQDWDGTFYTAWSNCPPWVLYDMQTNPRYGLGGDISVDNIDKWNLYDIARYCDELVDDGRGFKEPRFVCNVYFQTRAEAFKVISDLASVFRAITYFAAGTIICAQDSKKNSNPIYNFANANIKDGTFNYSGTNIDTRHTLAIIRWNDPEDFYAIKYEEVQDTDGIIRYGYNPIEVAAFGCTSRGQAHRLGKWILATELHETELLSFSTVLEGMYLRPNDVIGVYDQFRARSRKGGRVLAISSDRTQVTLDSLVPILDAHITSADGAALMTQGDDLVVATDLSTSWASIAAGAVFYTEENPNKIYRIAEIAKNVSGYWTLRLEIPWEEATGSTYTYHIAPMSASFIAPTSFVPPGTDIATSADIPTIRPSQLIQRAVVNPTTDGDTQIISLSSVLPSEVVVGSIWSVEDKTVQAQYFRITGVTEANSHEHAVLATQYDRQKFDEIENNIRFAARPISILPDFGTVLAPNNPTAKYGLVVRPEGYLPAINLAWQAPPDPSVVGYGIVVRRDKGNWEFVTELTTTTYKFDIRGLPGLYEFQIYAFNSAKTHSKFAYAVLFIKDVGAGKQLGIITFKVTGLEIVGQGNNTIYGGRDVKFDWRLNSSSTAQDIGSETWGASSGGFDPNFDYFEISLWDVATNLMVWHKAIGQNLSYNLAFNENVEAFGHAQAEYIFQVVGVDKYNNVTAPARIRVNNPAPSAPTNLTSVSAFQNAFLDWINAADRDIAYTQIYGASVPTGSTAPVFADAVPLTKTIWPSSSQAMSGLVSGKTYYFWITHVDTFGSESATLGPNSTTPAGLVATDIDDFFIDSSKIFSETVVLQGDYWTANDPSAGFAHVTAHHIYYRGVDYPISAIATDKKYIWWVGPTFDSSGAIVTPGDTVYTVGDIKPDLASNVYIIATVIDGVAVVVWQNIANAVIGSANIVDAAIVRAKIADLAVDNAKIANLDAAKITTGFLDAARIQAGTITVSKLGSDVTPANLGAETPTGAAAKAAIAQGLAEAASLAKADYLTPATTTIDGGNITTNSISAAAIKAGTIFSQNVYIGAILEMASGGEIRSSDYVSSGGNSGYSIPSSGRIHAVEIITQDGINIRTNSAPVFRNALAGGAVLTTRKYNDTDDISVTVSAPSGKKVRFESANDKRVTSASPFWPNAANTGDGVGPSDFLGFTINYVAGSSHSRFTGRISACVVSGAANDVLSDEVSITLVHDIPATASTSEAPPIPDSALTGGHAAGDHNTLTLSSTMGGTIFVQGPGEPAFRLYVSPLDLAPGAVARFYQVVNGLQSDVGDETNPNDP